VQHSLVTKDRTCRRIKRDFSTAHELFWPEAPRGASMTHIGVINDDDDDDDDDSRTGIQIRWVQVQHLNHP